MVSLNGRLTRLSNERYKAVIVTLLGLKRAKADFIKMFFNLNYSGDTAERMVKSCIKKLYKSFKREINVKFHIL